MKREILINGSQRETRVAILEDDRLVELLVDRPDHRRTVGDIYLGRVEAVLPFETALHEYLRRDHADVLSAIVNTGKLEKDTQEALASAIGGFKERFLRENADAVAA